MDKESYISKFEEKQKRLAQINKRMIKNMNKKEFVKSMLDKSVNISNQADY